MVVVICTHPGMIRSTLMVFPSYTRNGNNCNQDDALKALLVGGAAITFNSSIRSSSSTSCLRMLSSPPRQVCSWSRAFASLHTQTVRSLVPSRIVWVRRSGIAATMVEFNLNQF